MASYTALTLVNRIRRLHRFGDVSTFDDELSTVLLDLLNSAIRDVMESFDWDFNRRHDGTLLTLDSQSLTSQTVTNSSTVAAITQDVTGEHEAMLWVTGDAAFGNTPVRVATWSSNVAILSAVWPGTTASGTAAVTTFANIYVLPTTVSRVLSVIHQENSVRLMEIEKDLSFDAIVPKPHDNISDNPELVAIGGYATSTPATGSSATENIGMLVYPTPASQYQLKYTYMYRHPDLTATTSTLAGVEPQVVDDIVLLAWAKSMNTSVGNDPELAAATIRQLQGSLRAKHRKTRQDPHRRGRLRSFDQLSVSTGHHPSDPNNFGSLP